MSPRNYVEPTQWYATLSTVYVSACIFITDPAERILVVKPNYRPYWALPGGVAEEGESPDQCVAREAAEELGLNPVVSGLLVVDWVPAAGLSPRGMLNFTFDGGVIADPAAIRLQEDELDEFAFLPWDEATDRLSVTAAPRIGAARRARRDRNTVYLPADPAWR